MTSKNSREAICSGCGRRYDNTSLLKACGYCQSVLYCNSLCQGIDWPKHKKICKKLAKHFIIPQLSRFYEGIYDWSIANNEKLYHFYSLKLELHSDKRSFILEKFIRAENVQDHFSYYGTWQPIAFSEDDVACVKEQLDSSQLNLATTTIFEIPLIEKVFSFTNQYLFPLDSDYSPIKILLKIEKYQNGSSITTDGFANKELLLEFHRIQIFSKLSDDFDPFFIYRVLTKPFTLFSEPRVRLSGIPNLLQSLMINKEVQLRNFANPNDFKKLKEVFILELDYCHAIEDAKQLVFNQRFQDSRIGLLEIVKSIEKFAIINEKSLLGFVFASLALYLAWIETAKSMSDHINKGDYDGVKQKLEEFILEKVELMSSQSVDDKLKLLKYFDDDKIVMNLLQKLYKNS